MKKLSLILAGALAAGAMGCNSSDENKIEIPREKISYEEVIKKNTVTVFENELEYEKSLNLDNVVEEVMLEKEYGNELMEKIDKRLDKTENLLKYPENYSDYEKEEFVKLIFNSFFLLENKNYEDVGDNDKKSANAFCDYIGKLFFIERNIVSGELYIEARGYDIEDERIKIDSYLKYKVVKNGKVSEDYRYEYFPLIADYKNSIGDIYIPLEMILSFERELEITGDILNLNKKEREKADSLIKYTLESSKKGNLQYHDEYMEKLYDFLNEL